MRLIAGRHRGRRLAVPAHGGTRPSADRVRQALFDMIWHAAWAGRGAVEGQRVLDAFAGTGALGLEALSRGASHASFLERDRTALAALRANVALCGEVSRAAIVIADATRPPPATSSCGLVFLDPPYGEGLLLRALPALMAAGWVAPDALICVETERPAPELPPNCRVLAERAHGVAQLTFLRA